MVMTKMPTLRGRARMGRLKRPAERDPEEARQRASDWYHRDPDKVNKRIKRWREMNPRKRAAHLAVKRALYHGELERPKHCIAEDCSRKPEGHHDDYVKPLDVMWLCRRHHRLRHVMLIREGRDPDAEV
jgi:hypothetical protein